MPSQSILSCAGWNARDPSAPLTVLSMLPSKIVVHHTATPNSNQVSQRDLIVLAQSIQHFHMHDKGWIDTGQHFTINRGGLVAEGRHRSLDTLLGGTSFIEGTHCVDQNDVSIGIENEGTYTEVDPPAALLSALATLLAYCAAQYKLSPTQIYGHRDFNDTACPGDKLYALLPALRQRVGKLLGSPLDQTAATPSVWPLLKAGDTGPAVLAAQYLLRNAGLADVPIEGTFDPSTTAMVMRFQTGHGLAPSGLIGGGSWPLMVVPTSPTDPGPAGQAVRVLLSHPQTRPATDSDANAEGAPDPPGPITTASTVTPATWQRLLSAATP
jgi:N-acetylmuramoyl-L-alanine amidase/Putative peptidoglycan binding domain